jgi:hypothetical protein
MRALTLGRNPVIVLNVENPFIGSHTSVVIRQLTREEPFEGRRAFSKFKPQKDSEN